ncbi:MAG: flagellar FliJ family protein [Planctomycetaceae bacterium]|nr:flagellar FliJ family protein [Planctomycetaceae bacterium]
MILAAVAELRARIDSAERRKAAILAEREQNQVELRQLNNAATLPVEQAASRRYRLQQLDRDVAEVDRQIAILEQNLEIVLKSLVTADQEVKVLEKLREQQEAAIAQERIRREQREQEDAWLAIHNQDFRR